MENFEEMHYSLLMCRLQIHILKRIISQNIRRRASYATSSGDTLLYASNCEDTRYLIHPSVCTKALKCLFTKIKCTISLPYNTISSMWREILSCHSFRAQFVCCIHKIFKTDRYNKYTNFMCILLRANNTCKSALSFTHSVLLLFNFTLQQLTKEE